MTLSFLLFPYLLAGQNSTPRTSEAAARTAAEKLGAIQDGALGRGAEPIRITEEEANSYLAHELSSNYPPGLNHIVLQFTPGRLQGSAEVDFDKAKRASRGPSNPMMDYLFFGVHTLSVTGSFSAVNGTGHFQLESVALDGMVLPKPVVNYLIERFLLPRYPGLALDRPFAMPYSIGRVQVERGSVLLAGK